MIGNGKMPYGYVLKHLKLKDTPLYNEVVNARGNLDIKYIASNLALGHSIYDSVRLAKEYVTGAIQNALDLGKGNGPTNHYWKFYK